MQAGYASNPPSSFPDKRLLLTAALCICIILTFWLSSRYPALNEKAAMGGSTVLQDQLSFDAVYIIDPSDSFFTKVAYTTLNWINTNKKGMTLGVLLAAGIMTLLPLFQALKGAKGLRGSNCARRDDLEVDVDKPCGVTTGKRPGI